jgi:hypothetical protein
MALRPMRVAFGFAMLAHFAEHDMLDGLRARRRCRLDRRFDRGVQPGWRRRLRSARGFELGGVTLDGFGRRGRLDPRPRTLLSRLLACWTIAALGALTALGATLTAFTATSAAAAPAPAVTVAFTLVSAR